MADGQQAKEPALNDPFAEASQVPQGAIQPDLGERIFGMGVTPDSSLDKRLQAYHQGRLAQAQMHRNNLATAVGQLYKGTKWDPTLNGGLGGERPLTQDEITDLETQRDTAEKSYGKIAGFDPDAKSALDKAHGIIDTLLHHKRQQDQQGRPGGMQTPPTPQYGSTVGDSGVSLTPPPDATPNISEGGLSFTPPPAAATAKKPLSPLVQSMMGAFERHRQGVGQQVEDYRHTEFGNVDTRKALVQKVIPIADQDKPYVQDFLLTGNMTRGMLTHFQKTNMIDPETGLPVFADPNSGTYIDTQGNTVEKPVPFQKPVLIGYKGPNGEPLFGTEQYGKLYDQQGNLLPPGQQKFYPALLPKHTVNYGMRQIQQPNGMIVQVPTVTVTDTSRGGATATPVSNGSVTPQGANQISSPPPVKIGSVSNAGAGTPAASKSTAAASSSSVSPAQMMGLPKGSRVVGGKVPPGVSKSYDTYNGSVERFNIMEQALPKALKGDQQAMINLLYNHIGMTTGLQKGARITQPIIDEAQNSAPFVATILKKIGIGNEFEMDPTLLRGVVLDPQTMHNMIGLAKERRDQDREAWIREIGAANTGYGMSTPPSPTAPETSTAAPSATSPKTAAKYLEKYGIKTKP